ncbi:MAG: hypothetical protein AAGA70_02350 [Pseudomonadota bacterium]
MREFFINALETLITVIVALGAVGLLIATVSALIQQGFLVALGILIGGSLYLIVLAGFIYLALGIHANTKRSAELLEQMASRT